MNLAPQDVIVIGWKLVVALVAGIPICSAIVVWLLARFTKVFDKWAELKLQFANVGKLVEQTRVLTETTEMIKTRLSDEVWTKQQRWLKRLDCYGDVIDKLAAYQHATLLVRANIKTLNEYLGDNAAVQTDLQTAQRTSMESYNSAYSALIHAKSIAQLVCSKESVNILETFVVPPFDWNDLDGSLKQSGILAKTISAAFIISARDDVGYEPIVETA